MFADQVKEFCEDYEEYDFCKDYSGRFMYGRLCPGVVVRDGSSHFDMLIRLTRFLCEIEFDTFENMEGVCIDNLGFDTIVYFPRCRR